MNRREERRCNSQQIQMQMRFVSRTIQLVRMRERERENYYRPLWSIQYSNCQHLCHFALLPALVLHLCFPESQGKAATGKSPWKHEICSQTGTWITVSFLEQMFRVMTLKLHYHVSECIMPIKRILMFVKSPFVFIYLLCYTTATNTPFFSPKSFWVIIMHLLAVKNSHSLCAVISWRKWLLNDLINQGLGRYALKPLQNMIQLVLNVKEYRFFCFDHNWLLKRKASLCDRLHSKRASDILSSELKPAGYGPLTPKLSWVWPTLAVCNPLKLSICTRMTATHKFLII